MRAVDRVLRAQDERKRRLETARAAEAALTKDERQQFLADLIAKVEEEEDAAPSAMDHPTAPSPRPRRARMDTALNGASGTKTDRAEALVFAHPVGISTEDVAAAIGQKLRTADSTLRGIKMKRHSIERRGNKWYPTTKPAGLGRAMRLRDAISEALGGGKALGIGDVFTAAQKFRADARYPSVAAEIQRMQRDKLVKVMGQGPRGALYGLASVGGVHTATN